MSVNRENGWYLCSDGYMTSERSDQRIEAMKANRALDNHGLLVFVKFVGGYEDDRRVYLPHPGRCRVVGSSTNNLMYPDCMTKWYELSCGHSVTLKGDEPPACCPVCGKLVTR